MTGGREIALMPRGRAGPLCDEHVRMCKSSRKDRKLQEEARRNVGSKWNYAGVSYCDRPVRMDERFLTNQSTPGPSPKNSEGERGEPTAPTTIAHGEGEERVKKRWKRLVRRRKKNASATAIAGEDDDDRAWKEERMEEPTEQQETGGERKNIASKYQMMR